MDIIYVESLSKHLENVNKTIHLRTTNGVYNDYNRDFTQLFPTEISLKIFSYLSYKELSVCSNVNKSWFNFCRDSSLYKILLKTTPWSTYSQSQMASNSNSNCFLCRSTQIKMSFINKSLDITNYYLEYKRQYQIYKNWLNGRYKMRIFTGHSSVVNCVVFNEERIISGSADSTIRVWNLHTNAQWSCQTLYGHSEAVRCLQLLDCSANNITNGTSSPINCTPPPCHAHKGTYLSRCRLEPRDVQLISGSNDKTIKIWSLTAKNDWSSIVCRATLIGHSDFVRCLQADHDKIVSGSYDGTLKLWSIPNAECVTTFYGHSDSILCVQYDDNIIVSGSLDKTIRMWLFSGECIGTLQGHADPVACLQLHYRDNRIISGSHDNTLKFWSIDSQQCVRTIDWIESEGHRRVVRCLQADNYRFISGSDDKTIKVWKVEDGTRLHTYQGHKDGVSCLQFNGEMLVSGSYDHSIILWDFTI